MFELNKGQSLRLYRRDNDRSRLAGIFAVETLDSMELQGQAGKERTILRVPFCQASVAAMGAILFRGPMFRGAQYEVQLEGWMLKLMIFAVDGGTVRFALVDPPDDVSSKTSAQLSD